MDRPRPSWRALVVRGSYNPEIKRDAEHASGAYAIREKGSHAVLYVGESNRGRMWKTMLRHFHAPESFRKVRETGVFSRSPEKYDVALWVTSTGVRPRGTKADERAMVAQAAWIASMKPTRNKDDGMAKDFVYEHAPEPAHAFADLLNPARAWVTLGSLTRLTWIDAQKKERTREWGLRSAPTLAYPDGEGWPLAIVYGVTKIRAATPEEIARYKKSHWGEEGRRRVVAGSVALPPFRTLGRGVMIQYTTKKGGEGGGELIDWRHPWGDGARRGAKVEAPHVVEHVCQNERCAGLGRLSLAHGNYRVTERGIVG